MAVDVSGAEEIKVNYRKLRLHSFLQKIGLPLGGVSSIFRLKALEKSQCRRIELNVLSSERSKLTSENR